jgi:general transcription factor 3C polypeptide 3 (transcription factor C subunit 4)
VIEPLPCCRYQQAVDLLLEVIRQVPNLSDPYHTLGALHEVMDQPRQALNFYMIAAHMSGKVRKS